MLKEIYVSYMDKYFSNSFFVPPKFLLELNSYDTYYVYVMKLVYLLEQEFRTNENKRIS